MSATTSRSVRAIAVDILSRVDRGAFADRLLQAAARKPRETRDAALLQEIVLGTLTWRGAIDHVLSVYTDRPSSRDHPRLRNLLRSGVYQLRYLDRVPAYAVVSESVGLARQIAGEGAGRFVNAVLRGVAESRRPVPVPARDADPAAHLAVTQSHPEWIVRRWIGRFGIDRAEALCRAGNARPPLCIQPRTAPAEPLRAMEAAGVLAGALAAEGIATRPVPDLPGGLCVPHADGLFLSRAYEAGLFFVQGTGASWVSRMLEARPGERILDVCGAPGGKACAAAAETEPGGCVVALENRRSRVRTLRSNIRRLGASAFAVCADARRLPLGRPFDAVLVDAPCSALGILSRHPEIRWHRHETDIADLAAGQAAILGAAASAVRPRGRLVYATCTTEPEENESVVDAFLRERPDFTLRRADAVVLHPAASNFLRILPDESGTDGAFAACFLRSGA